MNEYFVSIKVDREERPDIDNIYMSAVQSMTGAGGWPLTVFLTPDKKPFFGGTYFSPYAQWGRPGFMEIMESVHNQWEKNPEKLIESSESITKILTQKGQDKGQVLDELTKSIFSESFEHYSRIFDSQYGGFGGAPKFPTSHNLSFLLRYWLRSGKAKALEMVELTLYQMANGSCRSHRAFFCALDHGPGRVPLITKSSRPRPC